MIFLSPSRQIPRTYKLHHDQYLPHRGYAVVQLLKALRYKPEVRGFDP